MTLVIMIEKYSKPILTWNRYTSISLKKNNAELITFQSWSNWRHYD